MGKLIMFKEIDPVPNLPEIENKIIEKWETQKTAEKLKDLRKDSEEYVYYDGPITANNMPHYGHVIAWTLKDIAPRYWSMKNYLVERNMGWDCQGLPVEIEVQKELGLEDKEKVIQYGIEKFNKKCRESVVRYRDQIFSYEKRIGRWFDESKMYYTMDKDYIESMWWSLKELYKKGYLYKGLKVVPYSTGGACALSHHEVTEGGYKEVMDLAITVMFEMVDEPNTYFLAWTTTPWTIPGNLLLGLGKSVDYVKVSHEGKYYILAKERLSDVFKEKSYEIVQSFNANELEGKNYKPVFNYFDNKKSDGCFKTIIAKHATAEDGTGIVHLAPYGEEDFDIFIDLGIPLFDYLDEYATFNKLVPEYEGKFYKKANPLIISDMENKGLLFSHEEYLHRMPICWRTKTPLIYKPIESWYIAVSKVKDKMLEENRKVNWVPDHIKEGMSFQWLSNARDWAISRNRFWGTPLPIWVNDKTNEIYFAGSYSEIEVLSGKKIDDPHLPYINEITWEGKDGGTFRRVNDIVDVWYDSGSMPFARLHYPFENKELLDSRKKFPAEYIAEGLDQVRLWFYTMHVLGVMLFDEIPYKNVVVNGMMQDKNGEKLSKSKRNFPPMDEVLSTLGADILRLFILNSPIVHAESARFYTEALDDVKKSFFLPLWNSLRYFVMYANFNNWEPKNTYPEAIDALDKWILSRLNQTISTVEKCMQEYKFAFAARELPNFVQDFSTWYIRRSREKIKNGDENSLHTTYYVLTTFSKLIAPFVPFIAEEMYEILEFKKFSNFDSVHFDLYPTAKDMTNEDEELIKSMQATRDIVSLGLAVRDNKAIKIRQPLNILAIEHKGEKVECFTELIKDEVNVKDVILGNSNSIVDFTENEFYKVYLDITITPALALEGKARELIRKIQDKRKSLGLSASDKIKVILEKNDDNQSILSQHEKYVKETVNAQDILIEDSFEVTKV